MENIAALALAFVVSTAVGLLLFTLLTGFRREDPNSKDPRPVPRVLGPLTPVLASLCPLAPGAREQLEKDLLRAGYFEPVAPVNFLALRSLLLYPPLLAGLAGGYYFGGNLGLVFLGVGLVAAILGYTLPRVILNFQADGRTEEIRRGLPTLMDTLGLTLSTGSSLPQALCASGESVRRGFPELTREVRVVVAQAPLRSLSHALDQWRSRQPIPELGSLVFLLSQGDRLGTDITKGLWELSTSLQVSSRQRAEAAANRSNFYMLFPTVLCLLLAAGLALTGPGIIQVMEANREVNSILDKAKEQEQKLREEAERYNKTGSFFPQPAPAQPKLPPQL